MTAIGMTTCGALPALRITAPDGAQATITLYGAHLVSWTTPDGAERLFVSARSALDGTKAIRGGVPVIFPQFAERGTGMRHGFARVSTWQVDEEDGAALVLTHEDLAPHMAQAWPHSFLLRLRVTLDGARLSITLEVHNTGSSAFAFSSALHTYYAVGDIGAIAIGGVQAGELRIDGKLDHIFRDVGERITLAQPSGVLALSQSGFTDAVVWNPGAEDTRALADMDDEDYKRFVCIEPALIEPVTLLPGAAWHGAHQVSAG